MKLDTGALRYLSNDDWRVLAAVEQGSKNHEVVPTPLIQQIAGLRSGSGVHKNISNLAKVGLIGKVKNARYDGYRLTYGGLDYLALNAHRRSNTIYSLGNQIGVGKESDIYVCATSTSNKPNQSRNLVLKIHRLGRISFRTVKANRDYLRNRTTGSWMYLSRLAAQKEHAFMKVLWREGFPVPEPVSWNRHTVVMEFIDAFPLRMIEAVPEPGKLYAELMEMIVDLAKRGLIHGDFNEFNILIKEEEERLHSTLSSSDDSDNHVTLKPILIDFPQTVSTNHANAQMYFDRDVACIKRYFERRFKYVSHESGPFFKGAVTGIQAEKRLDVEVEASGFSRKMAKELDRWVEVAGGDQVGGDDGVEGREEEEGEYVEESSDEDEERQPEVDDSALAERFGEMTVREDLAVKPLGTADFGLMPLELEAEPDVVAEKIRTKKKAAGWAI